MVTVPSRLLQTRIGHKNGNGVSTSIEDYNEF